MTMSVPGAFVTADRTTVSYVESSARVSIAGR